MGDKLRVGMIGTSWWADFFYLPIMTPYERVDFVAICGRNRERADEVATKYAIPQVYTDYNQMLADAELDAVIVSTPDDTHYEMTMSVLNAGLHVLCEKPVALNAEHAKEMYETAETKGLKHMVMYSWRYLHPGSRIKALLQDNPIGKIYTMNLRFIGGYARGDDYIWRFDGSRANGILGDLGSHLIDMARWLAGDVATVSAHLKNHVTRQNTPHPANDSAFVTLEHANGTQTHLHASAIAYEQPMLVQIELEGEKGKIHGSMTLAEPNTTSFLFKRDGHDDVTEEGVVDELLQPFMSESTVGPRAFVDSILDGQPFTPGFAEGYEVQRIIDAAIQSHQTGQRISL